VEPGIIIPLIDSVGSDHALLCARAAARTFGGRLVLLHPVPHQHPHVSRAHVGHAMLQLERLAQELRGEGIAAETQFLRAEPAAAIIDAVREYDARAVVRSGYERHDLAGWLRRMIIDEATRKLQVPVLIVPDGGAPAPAPGSRLRVLVPLDGSPMAESAVVHILGIARFRPLEIRLVHVVHLRLGPFGALLPSQPHPDTEHRATTRYLQDVAATLREEGVVTQTEVIKSPDSVARVLLDLAQRSVIDIIAMTTRDMNTLDQSPLGRIATEVLEHSPVPVPLVSSQVNLKAPTRTSPTAQCEQNLRQGPR
jgi:nucleotide-binding universal stress UspA family protein